MVQQAEGRRAKSCAAWLEGDEVSNLFSWQKDSGKGCVSRPATLKDDNWKAGFEALWNSKYRRWQLLLAKH